MFYSNLNIFRKSLNISFLNSYRQCSLIEKLNDNSVIHKLTKTKEDVASFVRFNRKFKPINPEKFNDLYSPDSFPEKTSNELLERKKLIQLICTEYEYLCRLNSRVPTEISNEQMEKLMLLKNFIQRQIFLISFYTKESAKTKNKLKKGLKNKINPKDPNKEIGIFSSNGSIQYGLWHNTLFYRLINHKRAWIQSALNANLWGPYLAFDWCFSQLEINFSKINKNNLDRLASLIYIITNRNLKLNYNKLSFNMIHLNLSEKNPFFISLENEYKKSNLTNNYFHYYPVSYADYFQNETIFYINPFATETLNDEDLRRCKTMNKPIFVFSPFTELFGLKKTKIEEMFQIKQNEISDNNKILFRKLPVHNYITLNGHLHLSFYIECLRDVLMHSMNWMDSVYKNVPKRFLK